MGILSSRLHEGCAARAVPACSVSYQRFTHYGVSVLLHACIMATVRSFQRTLYAFTLLSQTVDQAYKERIRVAVRRLSAQSKLKFCFDTARALIFQYPDRRPTAPTHGENERGTVRLVLGVVVKGRVCDFRGRNRALTHYPLNHILTPRPIEYRYRHSCRSQVRVDFPN